ncbi:MAG TPA: VOC family protein [Fimbriimonadaceae bacterium]|nr:VOC family protein [Fimbriimonadaceae bacterium]
MEAVLHIQTIGQIAVCVEDLDRATKFYRDVLGLPLLFSVPPRLAFFQVGEVRLMLTLPEGEEQGASTLYFRVQSLDAAVESVRAHSEIVSEPHLITKMTDHELWMAFFNDTEGNTMAFMEERR